MVWALIASHAVVFGIGWWIGFHKHGASWEPVYERHLDQMKVEWEQRHGSSYASINPYKKESRAYPRIAGRRDV